MQCAFLATGAQWSIVFKQKSSSKDIFSTKSLDYETIYKHRLSRMKKITDVKRLAWLHPAVVMAELWNISTDK